MTTLNQIREQAVGEFTTVARAKAVMDAITGLKEADSSVFDYANGLVIQALDLWDQDRSLISYLRKAASRRQRRTCASTRSPLVPPAAATGW